MKIIFFGSDDFALTNLEALLKSNHDVVACVTQPDQAKGRGLKVTASSIKAAAQKHNIPLLQPANIKDVSFLSQLRVYNCDVFAVVAYGKILPVKILDIPRVCALNVHGSLLPKYRGAAPINWAIINGDDETGISIIKMNEKMDAGDVFAQAKIRIQKEDTAVTLRAKMAVLGAEHLIKAIDSLQKGQRSATPQDNKDVTFAPKLTKELSPVSWKKSAVEIHNLVRGLLPWPTAYTYYDNKMLKILETDIAQANPSKSPRGTVIDISKNGLLVATGDGDILIKKVLPESAKQMDAKSFAVGHNIKRGQRPFQH